jgi:hypothetical protein
MNNAVAESRTINMIKMFGVPKLVLLQPTPPNLWLECQGGVFSQHSCAGLSGTGVNSRPTKLQLDLQEPRLSGASHQNCSSSCHNSCANGLVLIPLMSVVAGVWSVHSEREWLCFLSFFPCRQCQIEAGRPGRCYLWHSRQGGYVDVAS